MTNLNQNNLSPIFLICYVKLDTDDRTQVLDKADIFNDKFLQGNGKKIHLNKISSQSPKRSSRIWGKSRCYIGVMTDSSIEE